MRILLLFVVVFAVVVADAALGEAAPAPVVAIARKPNNNTESIPLLVFMEFVRNVRPRQGRNRRRFVFVVGFVVIVVFDRCCFCFCCPFSSSFCLGKRASLYLHRILSVVILNSIDRPILFYKK